MINRNTTVTSMSLQPKGADHSLSFRSRRSTPTVTIKTENVMTSPPLPADTVVNDGASDSTLDLHLLEVRIQELQRLSDLGKKKEKMWDKLCQLKREEVEQSRRVKKEQQEVIHKLEEDMVRMESENKKVEQRLKKASKAMDVMRAAAFETLF